MLGLKQTGVPKIPDFLLTLILMNTLRGNICRPVGSWLVEYMATPRISHRIPAEICGLESFFERPDFRNG